MSVFLNNLDDFIAPSQACVNPLVSSRLTSSSSGNTAQSKSTASGSSNSSSIVLSNDFSKSEFDELPVMPNLIRSKPSASNTSAFNNSSSSSSSQVATVSLNDCLACSGCVTSAEAVLIQEQSYEKLLHKLTAMRSNNSTAVQRQLVVVALSPNSTASLAQRLQLRYSDCFLRVAALLKSLGVQYVLDAAAAGDVALIEAREEFLVRYAQGRNKNWSKPPHSTAASATTINTFTSSPVATTTAAATATPVAVGAVSALQQQLPVLTSHCPGWVCYAEKTQPQALPYLSSVKSAQQILGSVIKFVLHQQLLHCCNTAAAAATAVAASDGTTSSSSECTADGLKFTNSSHSSNQSSSNHSSSIMSASSEEKLIRNSSSAAAAAEVYVVSVQPCFDKKLESSRLDFYHSEFDAQEVDLVLSTAELWRLLEHTAATAAATDATVAMDVDVNNNSTDAAAAATADDSTAAARAEAAAVKLVHSVTPDAVEGADEFERVFRCFSSDGAAVMAAATNSTQYSSNNNSNNNNNSSNSNYSNSGNNNSSSNSNYSNSGSAGSGGYAEYIFRYAAQQLFGVDLWQLPLLYKEGRNADIAEVDLDAVLSYNAAAHCNSSSSSSCVSSSSMSCSSSTESPTLQQQQQQQPRRLRFARAYGFRNIQSVMIKLRKGSCEWDLVEVMACPSGCNNGGGQLRASAIADADTAVATTIAASAATTTTAATTTSTTTATTTATAAAAVGGESSAVSRSRVLAVEASFHSQLQLRSPDDSPLVRCLYGAAGIDGAPLSAAAMAALHTRYHAVPKLELIAPLAVKW